MAEVNFPPCTTEQEESHEKSSKQPTRFDKGNKHLISWNENTRAFDVINSYIWCNGQHCPTIDDGEDNRAEQANMG